MTFTLENRMSFIVHIIPFEIVQNCFGFFPSSVLILGTAGGQLYEHNKIHNGNNRGI